MMMLSANRQKEQLNEASWHAAQLGKLIGGGKTVVTIDGVQLTTLVPILSEYGTRSLECLLLV